MNLTVEQMVDHVNHSLWKGNAKNSPLHPDVLLLDGMSGIKFRHFLNHLCSLPNTKYMEIGSYKGSTLISAMQNNYSLQAVGFDNWSEYGGPKQEFYDNIKKHLKEPKLQIHECDCFEIDRTNLKDFDIYFYDGAHDLYSQYRGISFFKPCLASPSIIIVDDWDNQHGAAAKKGTKDALKDLGMQVFWEWDTTALIESGSPHQDWWGGQYIAIVK